MYEKFEFFIIIISIYSPYIGAPIKIYHCAAILVNKKLDIVNQVKPLTELKYLTL